MEWLPTVTWAWDNRKEILPRLKDLYGWFRSKDSGILILGEGGTGKSTLGRILAGEFDWLLDAPGRYEQDIGVRRYTLEGSPKVEIVVLPGQERYRAVTWDDLLKDVTGGKYRGIILLGAYGYHSFGEVSYKEHKLHRDTKKQFLEAYLPDRRAEEIKVLERLASPLRLLHGKCWLLTVVAKQDLWWPERQEVEDHYREGEYGAKIRALLEGHDSRKVRHEFAFTSLVISNFVTDKGELLRKNAAGYDQKLHVESLRRILETIDALRNWGS